MKSESDELSAMMIASAPAEGVPTDCMLVFNKHLKKMVLEN